MIPKTEAIVLKSFDYRETSKIVVFYTKIYGKISCLFKGIRKDPRKFGSNVDKFTVNDLVFYQYKRSTLHLASHCDLKQFFYPIRQDYKRNLAANYCLELVDSVMMPELSNSSVYDFMIRYFETLETIKDIDLLVYTFQIKLLALSGFSPHLESCVVTGKKITGRCRFSLREGGLVAPEVKTSEPNVAIISQGTIASIRYIQEKGWEYCLRLKMQSNIRRELKFVLNNFLTYHLERRIKSSRFI